MFNQIITYKKLLKQELNSKYNINLFNLAEVCGLKYNKLMRRRIFHLKSKLIRRPLRQIILFTIPASILLYLLSIGFALEGSQQFSELANAFLHGHLNFLSAIGGQGQDPILYHGKVFWGEGPFPAILLMPFVAALKIFHLFFYQGYIKWLLLLGTLFFIYKIARILFYNLEDSLLLAAGFILGSVYIGVASVSSGWLFAQVVVVFLLFWSLYEYFTKKRWWLIGLICGFIFMTRATASPIIIFYLIELWQTTNLKTKIIKLKQVIVMLFPFALCLILIGLYNFGRFHSFFNGGYMYQLLFTDSAISRSYGVFSLVHIPTNFFAAFLSAPLTVAKNSSSWTLVFPYIKSNPYGISMFITSPYLLYLFNANWKSYSKQAKNLIITIIVSCIWVLSFYGIGKDQLGYRYSLDFLPEIFVLFMLIYRKKHNYLSNGMRFLLIGSGIFNFYLLFTFI